MRENSGLKGSTVGLVRRVGLMLASLVTRASASMGEVAMLRRMDDNDEGDWVMGTNASEDGAHRATATARERKSMVGLDSIDYG